MTLSSPPIPRILVIDDVCGRTLKTGRNADRAAMCRKYGLRDITRDEESVREGHRKERPLADVVFFRGQTPACASTGDTVENDLDGCLRSIQEGWEVPPGTPCWAMVLLDLCFYTGKVTMDSEGSRGVGMPGGRDDDGQPEGYFGFRILSAIQERWPDLPVIILSSMPRASAGQQFSAYGALGFLERNAEPEQLQEYLWRHGLLEDESGTIIGRSKSLLFALRQARRAAAHREHVLIRGAQGTGKELLANYVYRQALDHAAKYSALSARLKASVPFVTLNCGAMDPSGNLYLSDLFGHVAGAFTGARARQGKIRDANGGYLFMDEIGALNANAQDGLLRVIEYGDYLPIGSDRAEHADVCFITATNEDIEKRALTGGGFRGTLLDRLRRGGTLVLPSLDERKEDIPSLVTSFFHRLADRTYCRSIRPEAIDALVARNWPGNIRELRDCLAQALQGPAHDVDELCPHHLQFQDVTTTTQKQQEWYTRATPSPVTVSAPELHTVLDEIECFDFGRLSPAQLSGLLGTMTKTTDGFIARYLAAVLEATRDHVNGEVKPLRAFQTAAGTKNIKATVAWDNYSKLLQYLELEPDSVLEEVFEHVVSQRQRKPKGKRW